MYKVLQSMLVFFSVQVTEWLGYRKVIDLQKYIKRVLRLLKKKKKIPYRLARHVQTAVGLLLQRYGHMLCFLNAHSLDETDIFKLL